MATTKTTINIEAPEHREMVRKLDRMASRIEKVTAAKLANMLLVLPEESRPSREFLKAYVKTENA